MAAASITLSSVIPLNERRLRLTFSLPLASGAFTALSKYVVTSTDDAGSDPPTVSLVAIPGNSRAVEVLLGDDLVKGGKYSIQLITIPAADTTTFSGNQPFFFGSDYSFVNEESKRTKSGLDAILYKTDLVWTGNDYAEDGTGDLATITGLPNLAQACTMRINADGLPWAPNYGPNMYSYVDGAAGALPPLRGLIQAQLLADDRVQAAAVTVEAGVNEAVFNITVTPKAGGQLPLKPVTVPNGT